MEREETRNEHQLNGPSPMIAGMRRCLAQRAAQFRRSESGAVTVDFVVLMAAVVGLGTAVALTVGAGTTTQAEKMEKCLNIQSRIHQKDIAYSKVLKRIARRCKKL